MSKDEIISKFSNHFKQKNINTPIFGSVVEWLANGQTPYEALEIMMTMHLQDQQILKEYYHPNQQEKIVL